MTRRVLAVLALTALAAAPARLPSSAAAAQQDACLHGTDETEAERDRRFSALRLTRAINTAEVQLLSSSGSFGQLEDLRGLPEAPDGFVVQVASDKDGYVFNVKDRLDPCGFAYFSDQIGVIYTGQPIR